MRRTGLTALLVGLLSLPGISSLVTGCAEEEAVPYCLQNTNDIYLDEPDEFTGSTYDGDISYDAEVTEIEFSEDDCSSYAGIVINGDGEYIKIGYDADGDCDEQCCGECVSLNIEGWTEGLAGGYGCGTNSNEDPGKVGMFCTLDYTPGEGYDVVGEDYIIVEFYTRDPDCPEENIYNSGDPTGGITQTD
jgi:hypothetical protein